MRYRRERDEMSSWIDWFVALPAWAATSGTTAFFSILSMVIPGLWKRRPKRKPKPKKPETVEQRDKRKRKERLKGLEAKKREPEEVVGYERKDTLYSGKWAEAKPFDGKKCSEHLAKLKKRAHPCAKCGRATGMDYRICVTCATAKEKRLRAEQDKFPATHACTDCGALIAYHEQGRCSACLYKRLNEQRERNEKRHRARLEGKAEPENAERTGYDVERDIALEAAKYPRGSGLARVTLSRSDHKLYRGIQSYGHLPYVQHHTRYLQAQVYQADRLAPGEIEVTRHGPLSGHTGGSAPKCPDCGASVVEGTLRCPTCYQAYCGRGGNRVSAKLTDRKGWPAGVPHNPQFAGGIRTCHGVPMTKKTESEWHCQFRNT